MAEIEYDLICSDGDALAALRRVAESAERAARQFEATMQRLADATRQQPEE